MSVLDSSFTHNPIWVCLMFCYYTTGRKGKCCAAPGYKFRCFWKWVHCSHPELTFNKITQSQTDLTGCGLNKWPYKESQNLMDDKHHLSSFLMYNKICLPCPLSIYCTVGRSSRCLSQDLWNSFLFVLIQVPVFLLFCLLTTMTETIMFKTTQPLIKLIKRRKQHVLWWNSLQKPYNPTFS